MPSVYERFGETSNPGPSQIRRAHTVVGSETIPMIDHKTRGAGYDSESWRQIAEDNEIDDLDAIEPGQVLAIPAYQVPG
jgi:nucleoid-associated protein YgaU